MITYVIMIFDLFVIRNAMPNFLVTFVITSKDIIVIKDEKGFIFW